MGFSDSHNFSTAFKKIVGMSPREYEKSTGNKPKKSYKKSVPQSFCSTLFILFSYTMPPLTPST